MILADSSAWIEYVRATGSATHLRLRNAFAEGESPATMGIVMLEVLAGARDERHAHDLARLLELCRFLPLEEPADYEDAAELYRICRRQGTTVRRVPDCLIAAVAIRSGAAVLHRDRDFDAIARHAPLELVT